ncbi:MAG TPA: hypothetical protein VNG32_00465 [Candidatus Dormibacteraeota bacterium]|nr:hypothetical protein [Candidatus Dormibacteraeota bacterium]
MTNLPEDMRERVEVLVGVHRADVQNGIDTEYVDKSMDDAILALLEEAIQQAREEEVLAIPGENAAIATYKQQRYQTLQSPTKEDTV